MWHYWTYSNSNYHFHLELLGQFQMRAMRVETNPLSVGSLILELLNVYNRICRRLIKYPVKITNFEMFTANVLVDRES